MTYEPKHAPALPEEIFSRITYLVKEVEILDSIEETLSKLIENTVKKAAGDEHGYIYLNRWNAGKEGQSCFAIEYVPSEDLKQKGIGYGQARIALGNFTEKKIEFRKCDGKHEDHLRKKIIPALKDLFDQMGFKITRKREEQFTSSQIEQI